ncbi:guanine nucleotide binding (G protein), alpha [Puccinia sorghi]|uniref:Guanine nucleotide binding (G protein), alpha n=1 Tax=Puccinia sorghi TaxID=27349 RepID=A0A0L6UJ58_9BASI|nr:guanine nucleotide binding (G protein), alpha [Puccinia sorghi]
MGCGPSKPAQDRDAIHRSAAIDAQIRKDRCNARKEIKILLLGAGESGKSTLVKQMKCLWDQPYTQSERESYREVIFANTITSIQVVLDALPALQHITIPAEQGDAERIDLLLTLPPDSHDTPCLDPKVADAICQLWSRPGLKQAVALSHLYQLNDSASYYFDNIIRIAQPGYIPTEQDIVRSRVKSTGISESKFNVGQLIWKVFDVGGQRSERKKWIHCFENVNVLIFFVAINEYDQVLYEDECVNRMAEAATLFDSICNSQWFRQTQMILFFNKIDLFKAKLLTSPIKNRFPDYEGDNSYESAAKFIHRNFLQLCRDPNKDIITHFTCATDSQQISVVLAGVQESILRKNLAAALATLNLS